MKNLFLRQALPALLVVSAAWTARASSIVPILYVSDGSQLIDKITVTGSTSTFSTMSANSFPEGLAFDSAGNLYAALNVTGQIEKITPGGVVSNFAQVGTGNSAGIHGLAFDTLGNLYVADYGTDTISKIDPTGAMVTTFATLPGGSHPNGIAFDASGNLFVADSGTNSVSKITSGGAVSAFATVGTFPFGVAFDGSGNLYVANESSNTVSKVTSGGSVSTFATIAGAAPTGVAFDGSGNLYVADSATAQISKVTSGGSVSTFVSSGLSSPQLMVAAPEPGIAALLGFGIPAIVGMARRRKRVA